MKVISISSGPYPASSAETTSKLRLAISAWQTHELQNLSLESAFDPTTGSCCQCAADTTVVSMRSATNDNSGKSKSASILSYTPSLSTRLRLILRRAPRSSRRHFGFSGDH